MFPSHFVVVLDANVLFPFTLRDTLLRAAAAGFYQVRWSAQILDEATRNLVTSGAMTREKADRLRVAMERAFPEAEVSDYEGLVASMRNEEEDRHVAAAALKVGAQIIVTSNLRHFVELPAGIEAQSPDEFLCNQLDLDADAFVALLREQAADLARPPMTLEEILDRLSGVAPDFVAAARKHLGTAARSGDPPS